MAGSKLIGIGGAYSQKIFGDPDQGGRAAARAGAGLINVLGKAYVRARVLDNDFRGGRQLVDTPLISPRDNRMVPSPMSRPRISTPSRTGPDVRLRRGYLWNTKLRDFNDFKPMSDALTGRGVSTAGRHFGMVRVRPITGMAVTVMDYNIEHYINTGFAQAEYLFPTPKTTPRWGMGTNVIDQRSVVANLLAGAPFHTFSSFPGKGQVKYAGWTGFIARDRRLAIKSGIFIRHDPPTPTCSNTRSIAPAKSCWS